MTNFLKTYGIKLCNVQQCVSNNAVSNCAVSNLACPIVHVQSCGVVRSNNYVSNRETPVFEFIEN